MGMRDIATSPGVKGPGCGGLMFMVGAIAVLCVAILAYGAATKNGHNAPPASVTTPATAPATVAPTTTP